MSRVRTAHPALALLLAAAACHHDPGELDVAAARRRLADGYRTGAADIDIFGDGKAHVRRQFAAGRTVTTQVSDGDTVVYTEEEVSGTTVRTLSPDGTPLRRLETTPRAGGQAVRLTLFSGSASLPDVRRSWDEDFSIDTIQITEEQDQAHDGTFVQTGTYAAPRAIRDVTNTPGIGGSNCSAGQSAALQKAIDRALDQGMTCVGKLKRPLADTLLTYLQGHHIDVICGGSQPGTCGDYQTGGNGDGVIRIFSDQTGCGPLEGVILHEILHALYRDHEHGDGLNDPGDPLYGCQRSCFGSANSLTCSACAGVPNGTGVCAKYPFEPCPLGTYCGCTKTYYADEATCVAHCGVDPGSNPFSCAFGGICGPAVSFNCR